MVRLNILSEGQSEERTVKQVIAPYLGAHSVYAVARCVETSRTRTRYGRRGAVSGKIFRGGLLDYARARRDLLRWLKEDAGPDCFFTTMFDLYALPADFPAHAEVESEPDPYQRVARLEAALEADVEDARFIGYIQLHEFETLILAEPQKLDREFVDPQHRAGIKRLVALTRSQENPELIDDGAETCPSRRIIKEIPEYEELKATVGPMVIEKIGIPRLRERCPHFHEWLDRLQSLASAATP